MSFIVFIFLQKISDSNICDIYELLIYFPFQTLKNTLQNWWVQYFCSASQVYVDVFQIVA